MSGIADIAEFPLTTVKVIGISLARARLKVTVADTEFPPTTEVGLKTSEVGEFAVTVSEAVLVTPLAAADTCTIVLAETLAVTRVKVAFFDPAGTVTDAGMEPTAELPEVTVRITGISPAATAARVTVPVLIAPPITEVGENVNDVGVFAVTVREAVLATPLAVADT